MRWMNLNAYILLQKYKYMWPCMYTYKSRLSWNSKSLQEFVLCIFLFSSKQNNSLRCHFISESYNPSLHLREKCPFNKTYFSIKLHVTFYIASWQDKYMTELNKQSSFPFTSTIIFETILSSKLKQIYLQTQSSAAHSFLLVSFSIKIPVARGHINLRHKSKIIK